MRSKAAQDQAPAQKAGERGRKLMADGAISTRSCIKSEADLRSRPRMRRGPRHELRALGICYGAGGDGVAAGAESMARWSSARRWSGKLQHADAGAALG